MNLACHFSLRTVVFLKTKEKVAFGEVAFGVQNISKLEKIVALLGVSTTFVFQSSLYLNLFNSFY